MMKTFFSVCVREKVCVCVCVRDCDSGEVSAKGANPGFECVFACVYGLKRVSVRSNAKTKQRLTTTAVTDTQCFTWLHHTWT